MLEGIREKHGRILASMDAIETSFATAMTRYEELLGTEVSP